MERRDSLLKNFLLVVTFILILASDTYACGWYLFIEPAGTRKKPVAVRDWDRFGAYDTAKECEREGGKYSRTQLDGLTHLYGKFGLGGDNPYKAALEDAARWQCVASDDPRLK